LRTFRQDLHPFEVAQVRGMVCRILAKQEQSIEYADYIALAKKRISEGFFEIAGCMLRRPFFSTRSDPRP